MKITSRITAAVMILIALLALSCSAMASSDSAQLAADAALNDAQSISTPALLGTATMIAAIVAAASCIEVFRQK